MPIGRGDIEFQTVFASLRKINCQGLVSAECNSTDAALGELALAADTYRLLKAAIELGSVLQMSSD